jgi:hypothetical protein
MRLSRRGALALLAGLALLTAPRPAASCGYGLPSPLAMLISADLVVVGKVVAFEEKPVSALSVARADQVVDFRIVVLEAQRTLKGGDGATHVKIGLLPHQTLQEGQVSCFFLREHPSAPFFVWLDAYDYPLNVNGPQGAEAKARIDRLARYARLLEKPDEGLRSRDADDRYTTAVLLLAQHNFSLRSGRRGLPAVTRVTFSDDRLSRLMVAVTEGDWQKGFEEFEMTPWAVMGLLRPTPQDGWAPDEKADPRQREAQAKKWLREHAGTFRIKAG